LQDLGDFAAFASAQTFQGISYLKARHYMLNKMTL
jgi:hypothetical protein